ncbi:MAG: acetolactate synthase small subunit [Paludibacteraceae bacterium]|nr:acetolactate synthase small subunit [Candidatus Physcocola equi]MCQ2233673.1 acetolactate synthase small subunit [Paludibacteraceae bacterium]
MEKKLYTLIVHSENIAGILSQITAVFTRLQVNIESLNVSASSIKGIHKYTITAYSDEEQIYKISRLIEKKIDVLQSRVMTDDEIFIQEVVLMKISTPVMLNNENVCKTIREHNAQILESNHTYSVVTMTGKTDQIMDLYFSLDEMNCVLQYSRTGRIVITKSTEEPLSDKLAKLERENH